MGSLETIWLKRFRRGPMDSIVEAELVAGRGMRGNADQGGRRQVTVIEAEVWRELMRGLGGELPTSTRRANLVVSDCDLSRSRGRELAVGSCVLRIAGETKPCERMEEALPGLQALMYPDWRGGVYAEVVAGGTIRVGDEVNWRQDPARS